MVPRRGRVFGFAAAMVCLILLGSCGDDKTTIPDDGDGTPADTTGRIFGHVVGGFGPLAARVEAFNPNTFERFSTVTDSSGSYRLDLLRANYELFVILPDGRRTQWMPDGPNDAGIGAQIRMTWEYQDIQVDPMFGAIHFRIPMTEQCDGSPFRIEYRHHYEWGFNMPLRLNAYPQGGFLDVVSDGLLPGKYQIDVTAHGQRCLFPYEPPGFGHYIVVEAQGLTEWVHEDLPLPARVVGRLTGPWAEALHELDIVRQPYVSAYRGRWPSRRQAGVVRVETDGRFCLDTMFPDSLMLLVSTDRSGGHWVGSSELEGGTVFLPRPGEILDVGDLPGAALLVHFAREDSQALGGVFLWLYGEDERLVTGGSNADSIVHPPGGRVGLCHLEPGRYFLRTDRYWIPGDDAPDWPQQWFPGVTDFAHAEPIDITSVDHMTEVHWILKVGGTIRGRLDPSTGSPEKSARIYIESVAEQRYVDSQRVTTANPDFFVSGLADGSYRVVAEMGGRRYWYPGTYDRDEATILVIEGQNVVEIGPWPWP